MIGIGPSLTLAGPVPPPPPRPPLAAAAHEAVTMPRGLQLWIAFLLVLIGLAVPAALFALPPGWEVVGTTPTVEWGLLIVGYVFFAIPPSGLWLSSALRPG